MSFLPEDVTHPNHDFISLKGLVLIGAEIGMSESVEVGNIRHELVVEINSSQQKQLMTDNQAAETEKKEFILQRLLSIDGL